LEFRAIPPDPAEFPRLRLLWPPAVTALLLAVGLSAEVAGHQWNIHGSGALLLAAFVVSLIVGVIASAVALSSLAPALLHHRSLRTPSNLACTALSGAFLVLSLGYLGLSIVKVVIA
jgi:hypothetical protein